ncbi:MAG: UDP-4-amino-4,6-dideoxy-N-acetyl-beta-L-altrosamine transaminase [Candidatus Zapsychrus exili]|nr:UDP-4-amino-4,6-dideoxy-N-acetyl-beta-L-altrosamine transaminase [Candidatus Zapsychrus exili]
MRAYPVLDHIPYGRQNIMIDDIKAVVEVLQSNYLTQGPKIAEFEQSIMDVTSSNYCIAVNSGTSALHIACLAALVGPGDEVITSPNTFVASSNAIVYCGAKPIFADIDSKTYNIDPKEIEKKITEKTKAIIPVHFAGQSCDMEEIYNIVKKYEKKYGNKIYIIEDASHALGSTYKDTKIGSCAYSDMVTLSFHPVKHVTTGEGGAVLIKNKEFYKKLKYMRSHGITSDTEEFIYKENAFEKSKTQDSEPMKEAWYYEQICLGFNYRITDIQCALGCSQMKKISRFIDRRREIVNIYNNAFKDIDGITVPFEADYCNSNFHLYVLLFDFKKIGISRSEFMRHLRANDIYTQAHYIPVHTQPFYRENFGTNWGDFLNAEEYYQKCLSIPIYPSMSTKDVDKVISSIKDIVEGKVTK